MLCWSVKATLTTTAGQPETKINAQSLHTIIIKLPTINQDCLNKHLFFSEADTVVYLSLAIPKTSSAHIHTLKHHKMSTMTIQTATRLTKINSVVRR